MIRQRDATGLIAFDERVHTLRPPRSTHGYLRELLTSLDRLAAMTADKQSYEEQLYLLKGLRSGAATTDLFESIDDALVDGEVWFHAVIVFDRVR